MLKVGYAHSPNANREAMLDGADEQGKSYAAKDSGYLALRELRRTHDGTVFVALLLRAI
jgi:hypothetical protein